MQSREDILNRFKSNTLDGRAKQTIATLAKMERCAVELRAKVAQEEER